jgi:hypothetical protein
MRKILVPIILGMGLLALFFTNMDVLTPADTPWPAKAAVKITPLPIDDGSGAQPTVTLRKVRHKLAKPQELVSRRASSRVSAE